MYEKCEYLSLGYISALAQDSAERVDMKCVNNIRICPKVIAKDTNNISNTVRYVLGGHSRPKRQNRLSHIVQYEYSAICKRNYCFF